MPKSSAESEIAKNFVIEITTNWNRSRDKVHMVSSDQPRVYYFEPKWFYRAFDKHAPHQFQLEYCPGLNMGTHRIMAVKACRKPKQVYVLLPQQPDQIAAHLPQFDIATPVHAREVQFGSKIFIRSEQQAVTLALLSQRYVMERMGQIMRRKNARKNSIN